MHTFKVPKKYLHVQNISFSILISAKHFFAVSQKGGQGHVLIGYRVTDFTIQNLSKYTFIQLPIKFDPFDG